MNRRLVITGCQRSGTLYTSTILTAAGFTCGHERYFRMREEVKELPSTFIESSWMAVPWLPEIFEKEDADDWYIVHQVRHPLAVAESMMRRGTLKPERRVRRLPPSGRWIMSHLPRIEAEKSHVDRVLRYWILWNEWTNGIADQRWRVEDVTLQELAKALRRHLGRRLLGIELYRLGSAHGMVPQDVNHEGQESGFEVHPGDVVGDLRWKDLRETGTVRQARSLAREYGYQ